MTVHADKEECGVRFNSKNKLILFEKVGYKKLTICRMHKCVFRNI